MGLSLRLTASAMVCWSFVPLAGIAAPIAVCRRNRNGLSLARTIDLHFTGQGPWALWLIGLSAIWSWSLVILIFGAPAIRPDIAERLKA